MLQALCFVSVFLALGFGTTVSLPPCPPSQADQEALVNSVNTLREKYQLNGTVVWRNDAWNNTAYFQVNDPSSCWDALYTGIDNASETSWNIQTHTPTYCYYSPLATSITDAGFNCATGVCEQAIITGCDTLAYILDPQLTGLGCVIITSYDSQTGAGGTDVFCKWIGATENQTSPSVDPNNCPPSPPSTNCPLPVNCLTSICWPSETAFNGTQVQCTQCADGYWINASWTCQPCEMCPVGDFISYPCGGWTPTICSPCTLCDFDLEPLALCPGNGTTDSTKCPACLPGYSLQANNTCQPLLCQVYGCGAANVHATCTEISTTNYSCTCPGQSEKVVQLPYVFGGCNDTTITTEEVIANIDGAWIQAYLVNHVNYIRGVVLVNVGDNWFTLDVNSTQPISAITDQLKTQIANFLGGGYTASDIFLEFSSRKRGGGTVTVTLGGAQSSGAPYPGFLVALALVVLAFMF